MRTMRRRDAALSLRETRRGNYGIRRIIRNATLNTCTRLNTQKQLSTCRTSHRCRTAPSRRARAAASARAVRHRRPPPRESEQRARIAVDLPNHESLYHCEMLLASSDVVNGNGGRSSPICRAPSIVSSATRRTRAISNTSYLRCFRAGFVRIRIADRALRLRARLRT